MAMSVVQVSMEVWRFPCPDAVDDFVERDTSFKYDLFNASLFQFSNVFISLIIFSFFLNDFFFFDNFSFFSFCFLDFFPFFDFFEFFFLLVQVLITDTDFQSSGIIFEYRFRFGLFRH